jgi:hypothetical protein
MPGSLHLDGKLGGLGRLNAVPARQLIHMPDQISNRRFLVVIWLVQPYKLMAETSSSAHNAGATSAGATEWQSRVQVPPHLQRCADGATSFSSTCSRVAEQGASPFPPAAVCRWCHHLSSTQHLLSGDVTSPEDQRSPSADQGLPQRTSGTTCDPVCANPNPAVACASALPVSEPEPGGGVRFRYRRSFLLTSTPPHTGLGPVFPAGAVFRGRPPRMPAASLVQPASS